MSSPTRAVLRASVLPVEAWSRREPVVAGLVGAVDRLRVALVTRPEGVTTGTRRYAVELARHQTRRVEVVRGAPLGAPAPMIVKRLLRRAGLDVDTFFGAYPIRARLPQADIYHLTTQTLATLLLRPGRPRPAVVTVHDIIPHLVRDDPRLCTYRHPLHRWFDRLALAGLQRADHLIADSAWTKRTLIEHLGLPPERIDVVPVAADHDHYRPRPVPDDLRRRYGLAPDCRYLLYVGSEDPRKNLETLLIAVAALFREHADVRLLKVGAAHHLDEHRRLCRLAARLGIADRVVWLDHVPEADLPLLYNAAEVFVMPSLFEGFGLPLLEAMACGTPVVYAAASALPEVAGEAGLGVDPRDPAAFAAALGKLLDTPDLRARLRAAGLAQAERFSWSRAAEETHAVYARSRAARAGPGGAEAATAIGLRMGSAVPRAGENGSGARRVGGVVRRH